MFSTSPVWHCTLPCSLLITNLSSANSMVVTDILLVLSFGDKILVHVQKKNQRSYFSDHISLWISFASIFFVHKKSTTPRCSIVVHVLRGAAIL
jgi:hypothetical protein